MEDVLLYWFPLYRHLNNKFAINSLQSNSSQNLKYEILNAEQNWK